MTLAGRAPFHGLPLRLHRIRVADAIVKIPSATLKTQVRDALVKLAGKGCEDIGAGDLARVVELDLSGSGLRSLKPADFSGLTQLRKLSLRGASVSATQICSSLITLKEGETKTTVENLNLEGMKLGESQGLTDRTLPDNCFSGITSLRSIHLAGNRLKNLRANTFSGMTQLEWLDLSRNQLSSLPSSVFSGLSNLWPLDLGRSNYTSLPSGVFSGLSNLKWLAINNQFAHDDTTDEYKATGPALLTSLPSGLFTGLSSLEELDLADNGFTATGVNKLPGGLFSPLTSLKGLTLFGNADTPWTITKLIALDVRNNGASILANVLQVEAPPGNFEAEPGDGKVT